MNPDGLDMEYAKGKDVLDLCLVSGKKPLNFYLILLSLQSLMMLKPPPSFSELF